MAERSYTKILGLTEEAAKAVLTADGMKMRVNSREGQAFFGTCDFRTDRVSVSILNGKVTSARIG